MREDIKKLGRPGLYCFSNGSVKHNGENIKKCYFEGYGFESQPTIRQLVSKALECYTQSSHSILQTINIIVNKSRFGKEMKQILVPISDQI